MKRKRKEEIKKIEAVYNLRKESIKQECIRICRFII